LENIQPALPSQTVSKLFHKPHDAKQPANERSSENLKQDFSDDLLIWICYSGLNLNQDKATKPQTVQIVRQGETTPYWFKVNPLYFPVNPKNKKHGNQPCFL
ncbi:hypothetical protein HMPREF1051_2541, partial [Neisseria sicca VK64]